MDRATTPNKSSAIATASPEGHPALIRQQRPELVAIVDDPTLEEKYSETLIDELYFERAKTSHAFRAPFRRVPTLDLARYGRMELLPRRPKEGRFVVCPCGWSGYTNFGAGAAHARECPEAELGLIRRELLS